MKKFIYIENEKVGQYVNITQYGGLGIRLKAIPSPKINTFIFGSAIDIIALINSGERLEILSNIKGNPLRDKNIEFNRLEETLKVTDKIVPLIGVYDLPMIGAEKNTVNNKLHQLISDSEQKSIYLIETVVEILIYGRRGFGCCAAA